MMSATVYFLLCYWRTFHPHVKCAVWVCCSIFGACLPAQPTYTKIHFLHTTFMNEPDQVEYARITRESNLIRYHPLSTEPRKSMWKPAKLKFSFSRDGLCLLLLESGAIPCPNEEERRKRTHKQQKAQSAFTRFLFLLPSCGYWPNTTFYCDDYIYEASSQLFSPLWIPILA